ncbi:MAG: DUF4250 domain-containing protein [Vibrio sp.]
MDLSHVQHMDPAILFGIVNEKLRLECGSLDELAKVYELHTDTLTDKMNQLGFAYDPLTNQFKAK